MPGLDEFATFDQFAQFASMMGGLGLPDEWSPQYPSLYGSSKIRPSTEQPHIGRAAASPLVPATASNGISRSGTPFDSFLPSAPVGDKAFIEDNARHSRSSSPPAACAGVQNRYDAHGRVDEDVRHSGDSLKLSGNQRGRLAASLEAFREFVDPNFDLPSRHTLTRHLTMYFSGFNKNLPFFHHLWRPLEAPIELVLAICALGARDCGEHSMSAKLFRAGESIHLARLRAEVDQIGSSTAALLSIQEVYRGPTSKLNSSRDSRSTTWQPIDAVRSTLLLLCYVAWSPQPEQVSETFILWNLLAQILMDIGLEEPRNELSSSDWRSAIRKESCRRAKLAAITFLDTSSIAYDFSPLLQIQKVDLRLPCSEAEWEARDGAEWEAIGKEVRRTPLLLSEALSMLLTYDGRSPRLDLASTSFGNYILIHALIRRIILVRQLSSAIAQPLAEIRVADVEQLE